MYVYAYACTTVVSKTNNNNYSVLPFINVAVTRCSIWKIIIHLHE